MSRWLERALVASTGTKAGAHSGPRLRVHPGALRTPGKRHPRPWQGDCFSAAFQPSPQGEHCPDRRSSCERNLSSDQRNELTGLLGMLADAESTPARREFLEGIPEGFGLVDDVV